MDSDKLRAACEMAGMDVLSSGDNWLIHVRPGFNLHPDFDDERAWIESRCADILVGKVPALDSFDVEREPTDDEGGWQWSCTIWHAGGHKKTHGKASPEEGITESIITAAMAVLKGADNG